MDALSTPASGLGLGGLLSTPPRETSLLRPPTAAAAAHLAPPFSHLSHRQPGAGHLPQPLGPSAARPARSSPFPADPSRRSPRRRSPPAASLVPFHSKASTGYAAALLDAARCNDAVAEVERDVRRFSWAARAALEEGKGEAVRRVVEQGGFCRHLVALVRMLVRKGKVGVVGEVMEEFERIYDELTGTRVVVVSSEERMRVGQLAGIANRVRRASGTAKVKRYEEQEHF